MLVCVDFEGWSESRVLIAVVCVECLSESKVFFYTVAFGYSYTDRWFTRQSDTNEPLLN